MTRHLKSSLGVLGFVVLSVISCVSPRTIEPSKTEIEFTLRPIEEKILANGLHVIYIHDRSLPRVSYQMMIQAGSASDPVGKEGLAAMTSSLLEQGTGKRNAIQVADDFAQLGSAFGDGATPDFLMMNTSGLSQFQSELLELFSDVILHPRFSSSEIKRKRSQILSELGQKQDNPQAYADELLENLTYAKTPYGHAVMGQLSSIQAIDRADILKYYQSYFRPNNSWLAIAGNFDVALRQKVEHIFGAWKFQEIPKRQVIAMPKATDKKIKLYSKPGLQQTQIRIGAMGIPRNNPDFLKLRMANIVLGGAFASRLNQRVRDDLGLTYSISSKFETNKEAGSFEISTFSRDEKAGEAIRNTFLVIQDFEKNGITQKELAAAKALLTGQFPASIETVDRLAYNLLYLRIHGIADSYLTDFLKNVKGISLQDVNQAIPQYIRSHHLQTVVFADETKVLDQLKSLSQEVGELNIEKVLPEKLK